MILAEISYKLTLDAKEWYCLIYCEMTIETAVLARVITLSGTLSPRENLKIFEGIKIMSKGAMVELQDPGVKIEPETFTF